VAAASASLLRGLVRYRKMGREEVIRTRWGLMIDGFSRSDARLMARLRHAVEFEARRRTERKSPAMWAA